MSRAVKRDYEFDAKMFAELLKKAQGESRNQVTFAKECHLSLNYISKYLHEKNVNPPTPQAIKKIATACPDQKDLYEQLLTAAGYDSQKYLSKGDTYHALTSSQHDQLLATLTLYLMKKNFDWTYCASTNTSADLIIKINNSFLEKADWYFYFIKDISENMKEDTFVERMLSYFGHFLTLHSENEIIFSLVTVNPFVFKMLTEFKLHLLYAYLSIILVDIDTQTIIQETFLDTEKTLDENIKSKYTLRK